MSEILSLLWPTLAPGHFLSLNAQEPGTQGIFTKWYSADTLHEVDEDLAELAQHHVWFGVCSRRANLGAHSRGGEADIVGVPAVWVDLDYAGAAHASGSLPSRAEVEQFIVTCPLRPSVVVDSGYGYHCYWVFDQPRTFAPGMCSVEKGLLQAFQAKIRSLAGFTVDNTADLPRMLRMPGTQNWKIPGSPVPVTLAHVGAERYSVDSLVTWSGSVPAQVAQVLELPESPPTLAAFDKDAVLAALARNENNKLLCKRILGGQPLAPSGERNATCNKAANLLAATVRCSLEMQSTVDDLFDVLSPSFTAMVTAPDFDPANPPPTEDEVRSQLARALRKVEGLAAKNAQEAAAIERFAARLRDGKGAYSEEEVKGFAEKSGVSPEEFSKHWIIAFKGCYWTYVDGEYITRPRYKDNLITALRQDLAAAPIMWMRATANGGTVDKNANDIVDEYGTVAAGVRMSLMAQKSYYDHKTGELVLATAPLADITPEYNEKVDQWLRLLGGDQAELLLDWIASVTQLDKPSSAIYLSGHRGAGKTLLAQGLARLWKSREFTPFEDTLKFNASIAYRPLIFADEHTPRSTETSVTGVLRRYIANSSHRIEEKYQPVAILEGCVRVLLCANNDDLLSEGNEHNTREDIEAIAQRIVHIDVGEAPAMYLRGLGGRAGTDGWVDCDVIAKHALWLKQQRTVKMGARFLNEGTRTEFHTRMMGQGDRSTVVLEAILRALAKPTQGVIAGGGVVLVNTQAIFDNWDAVSGGTQRPKSVESVTKVVRKYAHKEQVRMSVSGTRCRYWRVDWSHLIPHGEQCGFNTDQITKRITAPLPEELAEAIARK